MLDHEYSQSICIVHIKDRINGCNIRVRYVESVKHRHLFGGCSLFGKNKLNISVLQIWVNLPQKWIYGNKDY